MSENSEDGKAVYDFKHIEDKWRARWEETEIFKAPENPKKKFYLLVMFAYPSGDIHMGHFRNYTLGDAVARYKMMNGFDVLHPFGWDAFGLPAENAAIKRGLHPNKWTLSNIDISRDTLKKVGISFDWSRDVASCNPDYYRWSQWIFLRMMEKGLAYRKKAKVNWCPTCNTVLANEQVINGLCERDDSPVEKRELEQWFLKITDYADRLNSSLNDLDGWPDSIRAIQKEWIGRSEGCEIVFKIEEPGEDLPIFTTRPDTVYGVSFMAIAPESDIVSKLKIANNRKAAVAEYIEKAKQKTEVERAAGEDKDGVFTGCYAINPFDGSKIQLWVADYVLAGYGTGVVMAVPAHDQRDFEFAKKYDIPIKVVIKTKDGIELNSENMIEAYTEYGEMVNSGPFDGTAGDKAVSETTKYAEEKQIGKAKVNYRLRDWLISRQRYWGTPIPVIHCDKCGSVPVPDDDLPVILPNVENYLPKGRSPLADVKEFMSVSCPNCGGDAQRDADTMDTFICSSWYFLRYLDPNNDNAVFDKETASTWLPVDQYIGGAEHAVGHLIYFRFFTKFLKDIGLLDIEEPVTNLYNHGMVNDVKGHKMSKTKGNVVSPIGLIENHGCDIARMAMFFKAPPNVPIDWSNDMAGSMTKFVSKKFFPIANKYDSNTVCDLKHYFNDGELTVDEFRIYVRLNLTIKQTTHDIDSIQFNTVIAALMKFLNEFKPDKLSQKLVNYCILKLIQLIAPVAPSLAEEMWEITGQTYSVFKSAWPIYDPDATVADTIKIAIQVNGKLRGEIEVEADASQELILETAKSEEKVKGYLVAKNIVKEIYVKGRLVNLVVK
ncbi:MAG: leucine--tRNA ligase [candidate division Zixibacteria bacterium]|nr:leucine--tRNA ligase [candidate division Zixibacteria bacterium]